MYIIHHRQVGGGVEIAFATFFPLLLTFNTKVLCVLKSGAPFNTDQYLLYVPNYLEFNLSVSEFMVLKIYNVKKKVLPLPLLDSGIPGVRSTYESTRLSRAMESKVQACCAFNLHAMFLNLFHDMTKTLWKNWVVSILIVTWGGGE